MPRIDNQKLHNYLSEVWCVEITESERGWGSSTWVEYFNLYTDAVERMNDINSENTSKEAPAYYMQAARPALFCDYYKVKLSR